MKKVALLLTSLMIGLFCFSQEDNKPEKWEYPNAQLLINTESTDQLIEKEARLIQIIPTGKRRQSYVFIFAIIENVKKTMVFGKDENTETVSMTKKSFKPIEFELWADEGGDKLLKFLECNTELPYMFIEESDNEKYNSPDFQPCIGSVVNITFIKRYAKDTELNFLLSAVKNF
ncbi:MAG: hypothetical protein PHP52_04535 [Bacteroidales bacterium]|nr:hypothetical protein [Bacteroidales bacterium]MDD4217658.1 hypothetical protein [Bacteroidales bacterium]MDY0141083.1 hypothetical protein [Bacteroidales bacterium]